MSGAPSTVQVELPISPGVLEAFASSLLNDWFSMSNEKLLASIDRQVGIVTSHVLPDMVNRKAATAVHAALEHNKVAEKWLADNATKVDAEIERFVGIRLRAEIQDVVERAVIKEVERKLRTCSRETRRALDDAIARAIEALASIAKEPSDV